MHTVLVIVSGILLEIAFASFGRLRGAGPAGASSTLLAFIPVWLAITGINMWIGVGRAGYTVAQELPVQIIVFLVPTTIALISSRLLSR